MRSLICMGTSAILWSIWLCRNDVTFDKKKIILLFCNLLDSFLEHLAKGVQQITFEVGTSHIGDFSYGGLRQTWVVVF
jgi:hypothetical protein